MCADGGETTDSLACPACKGDIPGNALVCRHCGRDVALFMPMLAMLRDHARAIEAMRHDIASLPAIAGDPASPETTTSQSDAARAQPAVHPATLLFGWLAAFLGLVAMHWLLVVRLDANVALLKAGAIGWPLLVAALLPRFGRVAPHWVTAVAVSLGLAAVTAMSITVSLEDGTPVLPASRRDLFETLEFALSIALAFGAGYLIRRIIGHIRARALHQKAYGKMVDTLKGTAAKQLSEHAERAQKISEGIGLAVTIGGSLIAGFRAIIGGN